MLNLVLFGPPGAGKGTQSQKLVEKYNLVHLSTGDIFRFNIKNATELGTLAKSYMDKGELVPDEVTINMLKAEVDKNKSAAGFIFDGFPRTIPQAEALDALLTSMNSSITLMVALEVPEDDFC
jgi:adenylate kinase